MSRPVPLKFDPNPQFARVSAVDAVLAVVGYIVVVIESIIFLAFRSLRPGKGPLRRDLQKFVVQRLVHWTPTSVMRKSSIGTHVFSSRRYRDRLAGLPEVIDREDFNGIWVTKPGFTRDAKPRDADVVVIYIHGGGYVTGQPELYACMLLRMAEGIEAVGRQTTAVFALRYSLAPEHRFPSQLRQAVACWDYVVGEMGVSPTKLALMGDSAGASIILSLMVHMSRPLIGLERVQNRARPGRGLFLISPWVNPVDETGYGDGTDGIDVLSAATIRKWAVATLRSVEDFEIERYLEFTGQRDDWEDVLPGYTWVSAGRDEIFLRNITRFVDVARKAGRRVDYEVQEGEPHIWQVLESNLDQVRVLGQDFGTFEDGLLAGAAGLAKAVINAPRAK